MRTKEEILKDAHAIVDDSAFAERGLQLLGIEIQLDVRDQLARIAGALEART